MKILLNGNLKGGVSKSVNNSMIIHHLAERNYRVLMLDFDPQCSITRIVTQLDYNDPLFVEKNIYKAIKEDSLEKNIIKLSTNIDYIPGSGHINMFERMMDEKGIKGKKHLYFRALLKPVYESGKYDFIIIDTSPSKSFLTISAMVAASHHMITTQSEALSYEKGVEYYQDIIDIQNQGIDSEVIGVSISMIENTKLNKQMKKEIKGYFGQLVFNTEIKKRCRVQEYVLYGLPKKNRKGRYYATDWKVMEMYNRLTIEILQRLNLPERNIGGVKV